MDKEICFPIDILFKCYKEIISSNISKRILLIFLLLII